MAELSKAELIKASPFGQEMTSQECEVLGGLIDLYDLKDGEILLREGQSDSNLYGVVSGTIAVARQDPQENWQVLHQLTPGAFVGELSFMDNQPRYASLRAIGATRVFALNRERLESLLDTHPRVVYKAMRAIIRVVHDIQRRLNLHLIELQNYIYKVHGKY
jgi:CRP-like cAMP-binding protein